MNWEHLRAFLWLQWRLRYHQMRRAGAVSLVISTIVAVGMLIGGVAAFIGGIAVGKYVMPQVDANIVMLVWDGIIAAFLFVWMIGLLTELQRSELVSLDRFLHLPVSLNGVFLINYIGTILCPTTVLFVPAMVGLSIGLVWSRGPVMLALFPIVFGFVLVITALTHQFQGWLAALMVNKRKRRTVIATATMIFVLVVQLPNLLRFMAPSPASERTVNAEMRKELQAVDHDQAAGQLTPTQARERSDAIRSKYQTLRREQRSEEFESVRRVAAIANLVIPFGWLAYGAMSAFQGNAIPTLLGALGLSLIGAVSLWRSYHTTLRLYTGDFTSAKPRQKRPAPLSVKDGGRGAKKGFLLEGEIPWVSEQASSVALACFRCITRAPEAKMLLLTPVFLLVIFGGMVLRRGGSAPSEILRPLYASGAIVMTLFSLVQLSGNLFGFDRSGFRTFVLSPTPRRDILLGKNLSVMPLALGMGVLILGFVQFAYPMRPDHFLAALLQLITMYLMFCLIANLLSILAPMPIAAGSLKPSGPKGVLILFHLGFTFVFPIALSPALVPLGLEFLLTRIGWTTWLPVYLLLTAVEAAIVAYLYPRVLGWQAELLSRREQRILEIVTAKVQ